MSTPVQSNPPDITALFQSAQQEGKLSPQALRALEVHDIGASIQDALGTPADEVQSSEVILVTIMIDDSGSIRFVKGNTEAVRDVRLAVEQARSCSCARARWRRGRDVRLLPLARACPPSGRRSVDRRPSVRSHEARVSYERRIPRNSETGRQLIGLPARPPR